MANNLSDESSELTGPTPSKTSTKPIGRAVVWICAAAVIVACVVRYLSVPSFWLDEAYVAVSLRDTSPEIIFAPLRYGQNFPRIYLAVIAALSKLFGYQVLVLRFLPTLSFIIATGFWARLLIKRSGASLVPAMLSGALLIGGSFWLDQSIQLKQYTLDVLVALIPFSIGDQFFTDALVGGKRKSRLALLAIPCIVSYSYPIALGARLLGWYAYQGPHRSWRLRPLAVCAVIAPVAIGLFSIWLTDYQFNLKTRAAYLAYWSGSILSRRFAEGVGSGFALIADFIWGWHHGRLMPLMIAVIAPLQALGAYSAFTRWKHGSADTDTGWGSRTLGSLFLLLSVILASAIGEYPISAGRLVLFTQVHTQILAVEGALFIVTVWAARKAGFIFLSGAIIVVSVYSVHRYVNFIRTEPTDNIRPMLALIRPEVSNTLWVHPCSNPQLESLPDPVPVERVVLDMRRHLPPPGQRTWIIWTNLGDAYCREWLDEARAAALKWEVIHEGPDRGLVLAEF